MTSFTAPLSHKRIREREREKDREGKGEGEGGRDRKIDGEREREGKGRQRGRCVIMRCGNSFSYQVYFKSVKTQPRSEL